jgi:hypothetical protein
MAEKAWIPVTQAAKDFGRSRQSIDLLIKHSVIECKHMGPRAIKHVNQAALEAYYAKQSSRFIPKAASDRKDTSELVPISQVKSLQTQLSRTSEILAQKDEKIANLEELVRFQREKLEQMNMSTSQTKPSSEHTPTLSRLRTRVQKFGAALNDLIHDD